MSPNFPGARRPSPYLSLLMLAFAACGSDERSDVAEAAQAPAASAPALEAGSADTLPVAQGDTAVPTPIAASLPTRPRGVRRRPVELSPRAESLATHMVFVPRTQSWFVTAARGKRMLVDVGRVDADLRGDSLRRGAYREAAERLSPLPVGSLLRLRGPWGMEDARVTGFDVWNGRIVATLDVSPSLDAMARRREPLVGTALRLTGDDSVAAVMAESLLAVGDSARAAEVLVLGVPGSATRVTPGAVPAPTTVGGPPPMNTMGSNGLSRAIDSSRAASRRPGIGAMPAPTAADSAAITCRDTLPELLKLRALMVRDSLDFELRLTAMPSHERLQKTVTVTSSQATGCFGSLGRLIVVVSLRAAANEYVRERLVALDDSGRVAPLRVHDYRFKAHDALYSFDSDGDGIDDLAARGLGERSGATVVLRIDPKAKRAERIAGGFAWESR